MPERWEICTVHPMAKGSVYYYSCKAEGQLSRVYSTREFLQLYKGYLDLYPEKDSPVDVINLLLSTGWEPFAASSSYTGIVDSYSFRRKVEV